MQKTSIANQKSKSKSLDSLPLLRVKNVNKAFKKGSNITYANRNVSFDIPKGKVIGLIGESGSGKTTMGRIIMNLHKADSGSILLDGKEISSKRLNRNQKKNLYRNIQMIFQDPYSSLNGQKNIKSIVAESLKAKKLDKELYKEYTHNKKEVLFYFENEIQNEFYKKYWEYRLFANDVAVEAFKKIISDLNNFNPLESKTISQNFVDFSNIVYDQKELANYQIISKLEKLNDFSVSLWKEKQKQIENSDFAYENEKHLEKIKKEISNVKDMIRFSKETHQVFNALEMKLKSFRDKLEERERDEKTHFTSYKNSIINNRLNIKSLKRQRSISTTLRDYNHLTLMIQMERATNKVLADIHSSKILVKVSDVEKIIEKEFSKFDKLISHHKYDRVSFVPKENIEKISKEIISKVKEADKFSIDMEMRKAEIDVLTHKFNKLKINDSERYVSKLQTEKDKLEIILKNLEDEFKSDFNHYKEILNATMEFDRGEFQRLIEQKVQLLNELRMKCLVLERQKFEQILKVGSHDKNEFEKRRLEISATRANYKKLIENNKKLEVEIKVYVKNIMTFTTLFKLKWKRISLFKNRKLKRSFVNQEVFNTLEKVGLSKSYAYKYPHEFSGGMRQRVGIARALISRPKLIIADEPIAALDLSIQAQIVNLLLELKEKEDISLLFIAHDLSMVEYNSDEVVIMNLGRIVEKGETTEVFKNPIHPYTKNLINSIPTLSDINKSFEDTRFDSSYLNEYTLSNQPKYFRVAGQNHHVLATNEQISKWTK